jgi:hypothetical protein
MRELIPSEVGPALLHNMSVPPKKRSRWESGGIEGALVRFALTPRRLAALSRSDRHPRIEADLERVWHGYGLRGAALVYDSLPHQESNSLLESRAALHPPVRISATDQKLVLNVLGRACGGLLLASMPLQLERDWLERELWTDDPRVVALARESGAKEIQ